MRCLRCKREMYPLTSIKGLCSWCYSEIKKAGEGSASIPKDFSIQEMFGRIEKHVKSKDQEDVEWLIKEGWKE